ncbi:FecR family protein [Chitinophaga filiformis]|uniref:FecR family protein n=1 Tax=Chitinophaga filiformis TaxID=104663 RepID=A0ABY4HWT6_CHIFI|nr:FecR family protein [Chitinophaga filiformis]UPK68042.1 FecR family protein [Chitinophaga filiformis]
MTTDKFQLLLERYLNGRLSNRELARFLAALDQIEHQEQVLKYLEAELQETTVAPDEEFAEKSYEALVQLINNRMQDPGSSIALSPKKWRIDSQFFRYAAIVLGIVMVSVIGYWLINKQRDVQTPYVERKVPQQLDSLRQTYMILEDGTVLILDSSALKSKHLQDIGATVDLKNRRLLFQTGGQRPGSSQGINTLVTPRGCQYSVLLPDSSSVWLNALSQLQFPAQFGDRDRRVTLSGEGFFEVNKSAGRSFQVAAGTVTIRVLGTQFNVQAYNSEPTLRTTIIHGKVQVSNDRENYAISAGTTLVISGTHWKASRTPDASQVIAWKQQLFDFRKAELHTIMPELSRWYDISYELPPNIHKTFTGKISRTADIATVLEILKASGIRYRQEGKKIVFL